jgi:glycosyltransferase involved in cell wall biosynthesis
MVSISFVIPTYNFAAFLPETLDSIIAERYSPIEIIVFDGGSSDNTLEVLEEYRCKFPELIVLVATERGNIDIDLNRAVMAATGDYIWTVSADDVLMSGWSKAIYSHLKEHEPDLMLAPAVHCDIRLRPRRDYPILKDPNLGIFQAMIKDDHDLLSYLSKMRTSEGLFSFCTSCLVRRKRLEQAPTLEYLNGTCWRYATRLISILLEYSCNIIVLNQPLIFKRGDNDSFASSGLINRLKIATVNWDIALNYLQHDFLVRHSMLLLVKSDIRVLTLLYMSQFVSCKEDSLIYRACVESRLIGADGQLPFVARILKSMPRFVPLKNLLTLAKFGLRFFQQFIWSLKLSRRY